MHVVLDISPLSAESTTGIGRLAIGLAQELKKQNDLVTSYFAVVPRQRVLYLKKKYGQGKFIPVPARFLSLGLSLIQQLNLPLDRFFPSAHISINVDWLCLPLHQGKTVSLIADLTPITNPEWYTQEERLWFNRRIKAVEKNADLVVTLSQDAKKDIVKNTSIDVERVIVSYPGISDQLKVKATDLQKIKTKEKYNLKKPFFLMVGCHGARKNLSQVLKAFNKEKLARKYDLVIAGNLNKDLKQRLPNYVISVGQVQERDQDLAGLYASCVALVYPSLKEGFGFPIIEAYYQGASIITSNCSSMLEIGKGISYLVDPRSVSSIGKALRIVAAKKMTHYRQKKNQIQIDLDSCSYELMLENILKSA